MPVIIAEISCKCILSIAVAVATAVTKTIIEEKK